MGVVYVARGASAVKVMLEVPLPLERVKVPLEVGAPEDEVKRTAPVCADRAPNTVKVTLLFV